MFMPPSAASEVAMAGTPGTFSGSYEDGLTRLLAAQDFAVAGGIQNTLNLVRHLIFGGWLELTAIAPFL
jgi:hypothetical protein